MNRVCVFAASKFGARPAYRAAADALGRAIAGRNLELVYGGARVGLMGVLADAALAAGGRVTGVIPEDLVAKEIAHPGLDDLRIVDSMHVRKAVMADLADAFIALPGGWGTFDELFEILTWAQLGLHHKPVGILNVDGYFDPFLALVSHSMDEGFVPRESARMLTMATTVDALFEQLAAIASTASADGSARASRA